MEAIRKHWLILSVTLMIIGVIFLVLGSAHQVHAETYIQNFDSLSTGALNGQDGFSQTSGNGTNVNICNTGSLSPSNSLCTTGSSAANSQTVSRQIATSTLNIRMGFDVYYDEDSFQLGQLYSGNTLVFGFSLSSVALRLSTEGPNYINLYNLTPLNWHNVELNVSTPISGATSTITVYVDGITVLATSTADIVPDEIDNVRFSKTSIGDTTNRLDNFYLYTDNDIPSETQTTRITALVSPSSGETTASTTVDFDVNYVSNFPVPDQICIALNSQFQSLTPICSTVTQSGNLTFSTSTVLTSGQAYSWRAYLLDEDGAYINQSDYSWFSVVTPQQSFEPELPNAIQQYLINMGYISGTSSNPFGTTSLEFIAPENPQAVYCDEPDSFLSVDTLMFGLCNLAVYLLLPPTPIMTLFNPLVEEATTRFPLNMVASVLDAFEDGIQNANVEPIELTLDIYGEEIPIMSEEIYVNGVGGQETADNLRYLIATFLWVYFAWWLFFSGKDWWGQFARGKGAMDKM